MNLFKWMLKFWAMGVVVGILAACSVPEIDEVLPDRRVEYKKQRAAEDTLEIPPDLSSGAIGDAMPIPEIGAGGTTYSQFNKQSKAKAGDPGLAAGGVLPQLDHIRVLRDGEQRWLEIDAKPDQVWPKVIAFWRENGVLLVEQDPALGVMKTDWLENRADIKQGFITELFRKVLDSAHSAATRDQFRVRLEPGSRGGTTYLYLTHRGMDEDMSKGTTGETQSSYWVPRATDPGLEAEMLRRIMVYLGVADKQAQTSLAKAEGRGPQRAHMIRTRDGAAALMIDADLNASWRLVGIAVERVGFMVEDRDRKEGYYLVRYDDPLKTQEKQGFFSKLAFWKGKKEFDDQIQHRIQLTAEGSNQTRVTVQGAKGQADASPTSERILTLLQEQAR